MIKSEFESESEEKKQSRVHRSAPPLKLRQHAVALHTHSVFFVGPAGLEPDRGKRTEQSELMSIANK